MDRFTWAIVGGVLALVVAGLITALVVGQRTAPPDLSTPSGVALAYQAALDRGDTEEAWRLLAASVQGQTSKERFQQRAAGFTNRSSLPRTVVDQERIDGDSAVVEMSRTYRPTPGLFSFGEGYTTTSTVRLVREAAGWRITVPPDPFVVLDKG